MSIARSPSPSARWSRGLSISGWVPDLAQHDVVVLAAGRRAVLDDVGDRVLGGPQRLLGLRRPRSRRPSPSADSSLVRASRAVFSSPVALGICLPSCFCSARSASNRCTAARRASSAASRSSTAASDSPRARWLARAGRDLRGAGAGQSRVTSLPVRRVTVAGISGSALGRRVGVRERRGRLDGEVERGRLAEAFRPVAGRLPRPSPCPVDHRGPLGERGRLARPPPARPPSPRAARSAPRAGTRGRRGSAPGRRGSGRGRTARCAPRRGRTRGRACGSRRRWCVPRSATASMAPAAPRPAIRAERRADTGPEIVSINSVASTSTPMRYVEPSAPAPLTPMRHS